MKKLLLMLAVLATVFTTSCEKDPDPVSVSFTKATQVLMADSPLTVELSLSAAATADLSIPVQISGSAVKGEEYTISAESFKFAAGKSSATVEISPLNNFDADKDIVLTLDLASLPAGYTLGTTPATVVAVENKEAIIYSFSVADADLLDTYEVTLNLTGERTGDDFVASSDMEIPFVALEGSTAVEGTHYNVEGGKSVLVVKAGTNSAIVSLKALDIPLGEDFVLKLGVDASKVSDRFIAGNTTNITVAVKGILKASALVGTWKFVEIPELEEWQFWAEEMEDDPALMPVNNENYEITFTNEDGVLKLTPGAVKGDLSNLLRESVLTYSAPVNPTYDFVSLGDYCTEELFMWTEEKIQLTYFSMDKANRAFSADKETLGVAVVAMRINADGNLELHLRDYDQPPFMENWWGDFDADMFGFCYVMEKVN